MDLERLRQVLLEVQRSRKLSDIPSNIYDDTRRYIEKLRNDYYALENPLEERAGSLIRDELDSVKEAVHDIFNIRTRQILDLAFQQIEGQYVDREETRKMLPAERTMFQQIVAAIESCRQALIAPERHPVGESLETASERAARTVRAPAPYALVHVLRDMDAFMGVDGRIYRLRQGDIVMLPERNADVLCERNIALNIRLHK